FGEPDERPGRIEKVDEEKREDNGKDAEPERRVEVERARETGRRDRKRDEPVRKAAERSERAVRTRIQICARENSGDGRPQNAVEYRALDAADEKNRGHEQTEARNERGCGEQRAERHERRRVRDDDPRVLEAKEGEEHPDPRGDREFEMIGDRAHDRLARAEHGESDEQYAGDEDGAERGLPRNLLTEDDGVGEVRIEPHAGRLGEG